MVNSVAFVLPIGCTLGGSNTWSVEMCRQLGLKNISTSLLEHEVVDWHGRLNVSLPGDVRRIPVPGPVVPDTRGSDIPGYSRAYETALPAVVVPNYSWAAYAAVAELSKLHAGEQRVIGVGHGHAREYQDVLCYYESIIHTFIATNRAMEKDLVARLPHRERDVVCRSCPVLVPEHVDREYASHGRPLRMVYAGRITDHEKRSSNFAPLVRALNERGVHYEMRIIGDGGYKNWLKHEIAEIPLHPASRVSVEDMMPPEELARIWLEADITFLVSNTETSGLSLLEGMAHGCVPVSTDCGGPSEYIRHGENGFLSPIDDMASMADNLLALAENREFLAEFGRRARSAVASSYSYKEYIPWFIQQMNKVWQDADRSWGESKELFPPQALAATGKCQRRSSGFLHNLRKLLGKA